MSAATPPTLLIHARDDNVVLPSRCECTAAHNSRNPRSPFSLSKHSSRLYWEACRKVNTSCTLIELNKGGHPFVTRPDAWTAALEATRLWLRDTSANLVTRRANGHMMVLPMEATMGDRYPLDRRDALYLRQELTRVSTNIAQIRDSHLERLQMIRTQELANMPKLQKPERPPPWISETWGDPRFGDNLPYR